MMLLGASLSLAGLAGCRRPVEEIVPFVNAPEEMVPGIPRSYATTMPFGRSAYGLIVESHEGRPTKIEGNPGHPSTLGASSARVQASVLGLYDPDRSQTVRLNGEARSWNEFVTAWEERSQAHATDGGAGWRSSPSPSPPPRWRASHPSSAPAIRRQSGRPTRRSATRTGSRVCGPQRGATSTSCSGSMRRPSSSPSTQTAPDRPRDDPSHARFRGRTARGNRWRRDEPPVRRRRRVLPDGSHGGSSASPREPAGRPLPRGPRGTRGSARAGAAALAGAASPVSTRAGSTPLPRTFWRTAEGG